MKGHTRVFAILNSDVQVRPATVMVSKVTVKDARYTNILMGTVQAAIAHGVLDAVRAGISPGTRSNDLGIIYSVWLDPAVPEVDDLDHKALFDVHREATAKVIRKAMNNEPDHRLAAGEPGQGRALLPRTGGGGRALTDRLQAGLSMPMNVRMDQDIVILSNIGQLMNDPRHFDAGRDVEALLDDGYRKFIIELRVRL